MKTPKRRENSVVRFVSFAFSIMLFKATFNYYAPSWISRTCFPGDIGQTLIYVHTSFDSSQLRFFVLNYRTFRFDIKQEEMLILESFLTTTKLRYYWLIVY